MKSGLAEDVFSIDDGFFDKVDNSYWQLLQRLTNNSHPRNAFCSTFSLMWKDFPSHCVLQLLIVKSFSEPSMIKAIGMEDLGFEDPEEDFEKILLEFRKFAIQGFLTNLPESAAFDGRVHLDFGHLNDILENSQ